MVLTSSIADGDADDLDQLWIAPVRVSSARQSDDAETRAAATSRKCHLISYPLMMFTLISTHTILNHGLSSDMQFNHPRPMRESQKFLANNFNYIYGEQFEAMNKSDFALLKALIGAPLVDAAAWNAKAILQRLNLWSFSPDWISEVSDIDTFAHRINSNRSINVCCYRNHRHYNRHVERLRRCLIVVQYLILRSVRDNVRQPAVHRHRVQPDAPPDRKRRSGRSTVEQPGVAICELESAQRQYVDAIEATEEAAAARVSTGRPLSSFPDPLRRRRQRVCHHHQQLRRYR